ncbi:hypothetical protein RYA05_21840, partial [Pseudomonas syringae pv. actinidiae]|nr:hypothetical protein [Pseudomonas syringae pv. actinidiae]
MNTTTSPSRLLGLGLYTPAEASSYTGIPSKDIRRWMFGYSADSTTLGHSAHDHLDTHSKLTWTPA